MHCSLKAAWKNRLTIFPAGETWQFPYSLQEEYGPPMVREFRKDAGMEEDTLERICYLVGHRTFANAASMDYQRTSSSMPGKTKTAGTMCGNSGRTFSGQRPGFRFLTACRQLSMKPAEITSPPAFFFSHRLCPRILFLLYRGIFPLLFPGRLYQAFLFSLNTGSIPRHTAAGRTSRPGNHRRHI